MSSRSRCSGKAEILIRIALILGSVFLTYAAVELFFLRLSLPFLPLKMWGYLPERLLPLAQNSKKGTIPYSYIMIVGDSYAVGVGDWYTRVKKNEHPPFQSSHIIHRLLGRDVISLGQAGDGSLEGIVAHPIAVYENLASTVLFRITPPEIILVYFYEGNDLNDNLRNIRDRFDRKFDRQKIRDPDYFRAFIEKTVVKHPGAHHFKNNFFFISMLFRMYRKPALIEKPVTAWPEGRINRVFLSGKDVQIPDGLQSPALELTESELDLALYVLTEALEYLHSYFASSRIYVVYIPSPLSSYRMVSSSVSIQTYEGRDSKYTAEFARSRSEAICRSVQEITRRLGFGFIDSRPTIWKRSEARLLHGPTDWKHFNQDGYMALADAVVNGLSQEDTGSSCALGS